MNYHISSGVLRSYVKEYYKIVVLALAGLFIFTQFFALLDFSSAQVSEDFTEDGKVWICHATSSTTNPYEAIEVSFSAIDGEGNNDHSKDTGDIFNPNYNYPPNEKDWGDIIPPVDDVTDGLNWEEGEDYWRANCDGREAGEVDGDACRVGQNIFQIGDVESDQLLDNPADEFSFTTFGDFSGTVTNPFIVGSTPTIEFPWNSNYNKGYNTDFEVKFTYYGTNILPEATLTVAWSPGKSGAEHKNFYLDTVKIGEADHNGTSVAGWFEQMKVFDDTITIYNLTPGEHTLRFEHTTGDGTLWDFVRLEETKCEEPDQEVLTSTVTVCKVDDEEIGLSGWTLMLLGDKVEDITVPVDNPAGVDTTTNLNKDTSYVAIAEGTWENRRSPLNLVDAEYSTEDGWTTQMDGFTGFSSDILELQINSTFGAGSNWGAYNSAHKYAQSFVMATDGTANFRIYDGNPVPTVNPGWYGDNFGSVSVSLYEGYAGITGENGCINFEDVPYGEYFVDEVMQDNWKNLSGLGEVEVEDQEETFMVVNQILPDNPEVLACSIEVVSDATNWVADYGNAFAKVLSWNHPAWTASVPGASWIWSDDPVSDPTSETIRTFVKNFYWDGTLGTAGINIAADNDYKVWVNGDLVGFGSNTYNGAAHHDISGSVVAGNNSVMIEVTNWEWPTVSPTVNPAGLLYKVEIEGTSESRECGGPTTPVGRIQGLIYEDSDGDGTQDMDPKELPMQGWEGYLFTHNSPLTLVAKDVTDENGLFAFEHLELGSEFYVCQVLKEGWEQTEIPAGLNGIGQLPLNYVVPTDSDLHEIIMSDCYGPIVLNEEIPVSGFSVFGNHVPTEGQVDGSTDVKGISTTRNVNDGGQGGAVLADSDTLADTGNPYLTYVLVGFALISSAGVLTAIKIRKDQ